MSREGVTSNTADVGGLCADQCHGVSGSPAFARDDSLSDDVVPGNADEIIVAGVPMIADLAGALYWPDERLLIVSDLHLEKGSSFARRGVLLPPYDTATTLERLAGTLSHHAVRIVIALGDNFHDPGGPARLASADRARLEALQRGRDWMWIAGNHDPDPADRIGGTFAKSLALGPLVFRHEPAPDTSPGEVAGHLHPVARISRRGHTLSRRCFAGDGSRLVMPAFGAYTGGLNIRHAAIAQVFGGRDFTAYLIGQRRLYAFAAAGCLGDSGPVTTLSPGRMEPASPYRDPATGS
jgi:DNA ligase-associated metallophosphoesterase